MTMFVDSDEYRAWHEAGHAVVCLHLGGAVELIELLPGGSPGHARARCIVPHEIHRDVACGGFAAEFYLLNMGLAVQRSEDDRSINQVVFYNATNDREDFWGRRLVEEEFFSAEEDTAFMNHSLYTVLPLFSPYLAGMHQLALELRDARRVDGRRIRELLRPGR